MGIIDFFEDMPKSVKYVSLAAIIAASIGYGYWTHKSKLEQAIEGRGSPAPSSQASQPASNTSQAENYNSGSCGNSPCSLPNGYGNEVYKPACDNYDHCANNNSDSYNELEISNNSLENGVLGLVKNNPSYVDDDTVIIKYKDGNGPGQGVAVRDLFWIIQDADNCNDFKKLKTGDAYDKDYEVVALFGKGEDGNLYRLAMTYTGKKCDGDNRRDGNTGNCNVNTNIDIDITVNQPSTPVPSPPPVPPHPVPPTIGYVTPRLIDNSWNEVAFKTGIPYEEIYLAFCEDGTDGKGKVIVPCTKDKRINPNIFPEVVIFRYIKQGDEPGTYIYRGYIPDIPGTKEATSINIGHKLNGVQYWEDSTQVSSAAVQNITSEQPKTQEKPKKRSWIRRIFSRKK